MFHLKEVERMPFLCKIAMVTLAILHLAASWVTVDLSVPSFWVTAVVLVAGIVLMGKGFKKVTLLFLCMGCSLLLYFHQDFSVWVAATNSMANVISLLVVMQLFSIPIKAGNYQSMMHYWLMKSFQGEAGLFLFATILTNVFASFLSFGTIPVMFSLFGDTLQNTVGNYKRFIATAIARGYALAVLWAPGAINLLLVAQATGVRWLNLFMPGFLLSLLGIATSYALERKVNFSSQVVWSGQPIDGRTLTSTDARAKAGHIGLVVIGLVFFTIILEQFNLAATTASRIMWAGFVVVGIWSAFFVRQPDFFAAISVYWQHGLLKTVDLAPLFVSMGIFSTAVQKTGLLTLIQPELQWLANMAGSLALVCMPLVLIVCAIGGIHPFISIVMFGQVLMNLNLSVTTVSIALSLALGGSVAYILSPFAGIVLTLAKFLNCRPTDVALHWNWVYCSLFFFEGLVFIYFWGRLAL
jgi:hypothetical protein